MKILTLMMLLIVSINDTFAQNAVRLDKGEPAPFVGVLVTSEKLVELDKAQRKSIVLSDLRLHQQDIIEYHKDDARLQRKRLSEAKYDSWLGNVGYFLLGTILTGVAFTVADKFRDI